MAKLQNMWKLSLNFYSSKFSKIKTILPNTNLSNIFGFIKSLSELNMQKSLKKKYCSLISPYSIIQHFVQLKKIKYLILGILPATWGWVANKLGMSVCEINIYIYCLINTMDAQGCLAGGNCYVCFASRTFNIVICGYSNYHNFSLWLQN